MKIVCLVRIPYPKDCLKCPLWDRCKGKASNKQIEKWSRELTKR